MSVPNQAIYRASAVRKYMQSQEKSAYLRFIPLPLTIMLWILLGIFLVAGFMAWNQEVPNYVNVSGLIVQVPSAKTQGHPQTAGTKIVLFASPEQAATMVDGMPVRLFILSSTQPLEGQIASIAKETRSPADIHTRYEAANCSLMVAQPVREVTVALKTSVAQYNGSVLAAQVTVGSRRLLGLLPGIGQFFAK